MNLLPENLLRVALAATLCALLAGCDERPKKLTDADRATIFCIKAVKRVLKSPSSFVLISDSYSDYHEYEDPITVWVDFDSQNAYGAVLRGHARCKFSAALGEKLPWKPDLLTGLRVGGTIFDDTWADYQLIRNEIKRDGWQ